MRSGQPRNKMQDKGKKGLGKVKDGAAKAYRRVTGRDIRDLVADYNETVTQILVGMDDAIREHTDRIRRLEEDRPAGVHVAHSPARPAEPAPVSARAVRFALVASVAAGVLAAASLALAVLK